MIYTSKNLKATFRLAQIIANNIQPPYFILLKGNLGSGKTTLTKFIGQELGVKEIINSPTFVTMNIYEGKNNIQITHIDGYRLDNTNDLSMYSEQLDNRINIIEWFENISSIINFNEPYLMLDINVINNIRKIAITGKGSSYENIIETLKK